MRVWNRHIWISAGLTAHGTNVLVPFSAPEMTLRLRGVLHAAKPTTNHRTRRRTIDTLCGRRAYPAVIHVDEEHAIVPVWPVPVRFAMGDHCRECVAAAERKRPDAMYREMVLASTSPEAGT